MAFGLSQRFPLPPSYNRISDPGAYQKVSGPITQINKAPFLSKAPRRTGTKNKLWCHAIYSIATSPRIVNCAVLKSKLPRFPYEALTQEDVEKFLCQCDIQSCECPSSEHEEEEIVCQGKVHRRIYKGAPPRVNQFQINTKVSAIQPSFYDTNVTESTAYYKGCKWSRWTSKRSDNFIDSGPGPADYTIENKPNYETICAEKVRAQKRKTSKQLRYIEIIQRRQMRERFPGPGSYNPKILRCTDLKYLGSKAERFLTHKYNKCPGPSDYWVKRDFEPHEMPDKICIAKLNDPAPFGVKAIRFKPKHEEGPSPASYVFKSETCRFMHCSKAAFGSSAVRFKEFVLMSDDESDEISEEPSHSESKLNHKDMCALPSWPFKSKTIRMKPLFKRYDEPSPADLPQCKNKILRSSQLQTTAPFFSSDERFRPWFNWISVHGGKNTPGPCYYCLENPKCLPAVPRGPLSRSPRFKAVISHTPSPNTYNINGGIENVLATHNERLKGNIENQHKFSWKPPHIKRNLSLAEKQEIVLNRSIELLNDMI